MSPRPPVRQRLILEILREEGGEWSVAEVAAVLGLSPHKTYSVGKTMTAMYTRSLLNRRRIMSPKSMHLYRLAEA